jgi:hypothetical protein
MSVAYSVGPARLSAREIFSHVKKEWMKNLTFGDHLNFSYEMPLWRKCLIKTIIASTNEEFYIRVFDFNISKELMLSVKPGSDGLIGGAELTAAVDEMLAIAPNFFQNILEIGLSLGMIVCRKTDETQQTGDTLLGRHFGWYVGC